MTEITRWSGRRGSRTAKRPRQRRWGSRFCVANGGAPPSLRPVAPAATMGLQRDKLFRGSSAGAGSMPALALPRPRRSKGRPKGRTDASERGAGRGFQERGSAGRAIISCPLVPPRKRCVGRWQIPAKPARRQHQAIPLHSIRLYRWPHRVGGITGAAANLRQRHTGRGKVTGCALTRRGPTGPAKAVRARSPGVGETSRVSPTKRRWRKRASAGVARRWPSHSCQGKGRGGAARRGSAPPDGVNRTRRAWLRRGRGPVRRCGKRGSGPGRLSAPATGSIAARNPDRRLPRRG